MRSSNNVYEVIGECFVAFAFTTTIILLVAWIGGYL